MFIDDDDESESEDDALCRLDLTFRSLLGDSISLVSIKIEFKYSPGFFMTYFLLLKRKIKVAICTQLPITLSPER